MSKSQSEVNHQLTRINGLRRADGPHVARLPGGRVVLPVLQTRVRDALDPLLAVEDQRGVFATVGDDLVLPEVPVLLLHGVVRDELGELAVRGLGLLGRALPPALVPL